MAEFSHFFPTGQLIPAPPRLLALVPAYSRLFPLIGAIGFRALKGAPRAGCVRIPIHDFARTTGPFGATITLTYNRKKVKENLASVRRA